MAPKTMARKAAPSTATTPRSRLAAAIKAARDVMRKDAGLSGEIDRIPQLAWLLFLKAFDAREQQREVTERHFTASIEYPYRWRDWAAGPDPATGPELLSFVNDQLLPHLRSLTGTGESDPRDTLAAVFKETYNRMLSGYLLREVIDQVDSINFTSADDIHTMAHLYESMLRELRDAAGDSGEFYTPRPVIRFIVQQVSPQLGESILDPACGTGGFLVEALEELEPAVETAAQRRRLQRNLRGIEKKPLPYLLGMMNLLLHGIEQPALVRDNALSYPITQVRRADRVDIIVTNPPFGGEEERVIQANFPAAVRTSETSLLFLQLVQRRLAQGGRCGMVVPNGVLFGEGVASRIRQDLLEECNVHTIVRLPPGAFAPYTDIPSNLLFFEKTGRTREVWFYEIPPPNGRKKYSKTKPLGFDELRECQRWWGGESREGRVEDEWAWRVPIGEIEAADWNLDQRNPSRAKDAGYRPPEQLIADLVSVEQQIMALLEDTRGDVVNLRSGPDGSSAAVRAWPVVALHDVLAPAPDPHPVASDRDYPNVGIYSFGRGLFEKPAIHGSQTSARTLFRIAAGQFIYSRLFAFEGAYALVPDLYDGYFVSNEFPTFDIDAERLDPRFLQAYFRWPRVWDEISSGSRGLGVRRQRVRPAQLLKHSVPLPPLDVQRRLSDAFEASLRIGALAQVTAEVADALGPAIINRVFAP